MPIYEYRCGKCGHEFEEWQKITDPATARCSECGGEAGRLISNTSFVLKGTGWYATDYARKDKPSASTSASSSTETKPSSSESKKSETATSD